MRYLLLLPLLCSCSLPSVSSMQGKLETLQGGLTQAGVTLSQLDKDGDSKISLTEALAGLAAVGGLFGVRNIMSTKEKNAKFASMERRLPPSPPV